MSHPGVDDTQADLDFAAGFDLDTPPTERPEGEQKSEPKSETKPVTKVEQKVAAKPAPKPEPAPPEYRQITRAEFDSLQSAAAKTADLEKQLSKAFGTLGDMQQVVKKLQTETPAGKAIELPADVVSEMEKEFPEIAGHVRSALEKAIKGIRGTGGEPGTGANLEDVNRLVEAAAIKNEIEALEDAHPKWREIVGVVDSEGRHDPSNEYRKWLAKQDAGYQHRINTTNSSTVISRSIDKFLASKAAPAKPKQPAPKVVARTDRIKAAIQPRGDGGQPAPSKTADDEFQEGFRSG